MLHIVYNQNAGSPDSRAILPEVLSLVHHYTLHGTASGSNLASIYSDIQHGDTVIIAGGDGTLHSFVNNLPDKSRQLNFVLLPTGTANALYSSLYPGDTSRLKSLQAYLSGQPTIPLSVFAVNTGKENIFSHVVTSTCLHAQILHDAEALRTSHPGPERFTLAAQQSVGAFYPGKATLHGQTQLWDPTAQKWQDTTVKELEGPFGYFTAVMVARLEPTFHIAPKSNPGVRPDDRIDIVVVRPARNPAIKEQMDKGELNTKEEQQKVFGGLLMGAMKGAFEDGKHLDVKHEGSDNTIVEYYRAGGFEWVYQDKGLACVDGTVTEVSTIKVDSAPGMNLRLFR